MLIKPSFVSFILSIVSLSNNLNNSHITALNTSKPAKANSNGAVSSPIIERFIAILRSFITILLKFSNFSSVSFVHRSSKFSSSIRSDNITYIESSFPYSPNMISTLVLARRVLMVLPMVPISCTCPTIVFIDMYVEMSFSKLLSIASIFLLLKLLLSANSLMLAHISFRHDIAHFSFSPKITGVGTGRFVKSWNMFKTFVITSNKPCFPFVVVVLFVISRSCFFLVLLFIERIVVSTFSGSDTSTSKILFMLVKSKPLNVETMMFTMSRRSD